MLKCYNLTINRNHYRILEDKESKTFTAEKGYLTVMDGWADIDFEPIAEPRNDFYSSLEDIENHSGVWIYWEADGKYFIC